MPTIHWASACCSACFLARFGQLLRSLSHSERGSGTRLQINQIQLQGKVSAAQRLLCASTPSEQGLVSCSLL